MKIEKNGKVSRKKKGKILKTSKKIIKIGTIFFSSL